MTVMRTVAAFSLSEHDTRLLRAALLPEPEGAMAWQKLRPTLDIDADGGEARRLLPLLWRNLVDLGIDDPEMPRLAGIYRYWNHRMEELRSGSIAATDALEQEGVPVLLYRGLALGIGVYGDPALRPSNDADLLVPPSAGPDTIRVLAANGWARTGDSRAGSAGGTVSLRSPSGVQLVVHSAYSPDLPAQSAAGLFPDPWRPLSSPTEVPVLPWDWEVARLCIEGLRSGSGCIVRSLMDLHVLLDAVEIDWASVEEIARRHGALSTLRDAALFLRDGLDAAVPERVAERLAASVPPARDRLATQVLSTRPGWLGELPHTVARHLRADPEGALLDAAIGMPGHLREEWGDGRTGAALLHAADRARRPVATSRYRAARGARAERRQADALVLDCVRSELGRPPRETATDPLRDPAVHALLVDTAVRHRVVGFVHRAMARSATPPLPGLAERHRVDRRIHLLTTALLDEVTTALEDLAEPWLVLKGPVLSHAYYPHPALRSYSDLDLLVGPDGFGAALSSLESAGFEVLDRNWTLVAEMLAGELMLRRPGRPAIDLHWHLLFDEGLRDRFDIPIAEVIERACPVSVAGRRVRTLDPADTLIHLAMHACQEGGGRLIWLVDIDRAVEHPSLDWDRVVSRSRQWKTNLMVATMLSRAQMTLDSPVPGDVVRALWGGRAWHAGFRQLDRWFPPERTTDRGTPATLVARSVSDTMTRTLAGVGSGVARRTRLAAGARSIDWKPTRLDPGNVGSVLFPSGGARERDTYLERVRSHA